jgi:hypothetical protein
VKFQKKIQIKRAGLQFLFRAVQGRAVIQDFLDVEGARLLANFNGALFLLPNPDVLLSPLTPAKRSFLQK